MIAEEAHPDANIFWGVAFDPELEDEMRVTIIATGFDKKDAPLAKKDASKASPSAFAGANARTAAKQPAEEQLETETVEVPPVLSEDEFNEILTMLNRPKRRDTNETSAPVSRNPHRRF